MALVHPLHPITSRSKNKRRNLWVGWCVSSRWPCFWSVYSIYYYTHVMYHSCILTHWGLVTHICVSKLTIIGSDNGLSPGRRQAIIWNNAGLLLIEPIGTNFSEITIGIQRFSFNEMHLNMSSAKWRPFCLGLNELNKPSKSRTECTFLWM